MTISRLILIAIISFGSIPATGQSTYQNITVEQSDSLIKARTDTANFIILDVRTPAEYSKGHLEDAVLVNFLGKGFGMELGKLDKRKTYLVYCRTGGRSANALKKMKRRRFREVYNMLGGIRDWTGGGYPIIIEDK